MYSGGIYIGRDRASANSYGNFLLADAQFVDGQALAPTDFGETRSSDGVWVPKEYSGTYGTNGFHLNFSDSSTNEALGFDSAPTTPDPDPKKGMDVITYTGTYARLNVGGLHFEPGLVWIKNRSSTSAHFLADNVRGGTKVLQSNSTDGENTRSNHILSFNPDGFTLGADGTSNYPSGNSFVAWVWRAGGPAVSNTDGSITTQVSANTDYGFSIVKWTANNTYATIGHGLTNQTPKFILVKSTASGTNWVVYHHSLGNTGGVNLNLTNALNTDQDYWNNTSPTTSVFSVGNFANYQTAEHVAYVWSEVPGYSKISSYTGNGSSTGPVITTGFKVRWLLVKRTDSGSTDNWALYDSERDSVNPNSKRLFPNLSNAESDASGNNVDFLDDGFQPKSTSDGTNANGGNYIYIAFADRPGNHFDVNNIVTNEGLAANKDNFDVVTYSGNGGKQKIGGGATASEGVTATGTGGVSGISSSYPISGAFDGATATYLATNAANISSNAAVLTVTFPSGNQPSYSSSVVLEVWASTTDTVKVAINGGAYQTVSAPSSDWQQHAVATGSGTITEIKVSRIKGNTNNGSAELRGIIVDGVQLLDGTDVGLKFQPDFVWIKSRSNTEGHYLANSVGGLDKNMQSHTTNAEQTNTNGITAADTNGFRVGNSGRVNDSTETYVAWCWKAGGTAVSNTDGSITSSVSANPNNGFSIVTASPSNNAVSIGHGLSTAPRMIISKSRTVAYDWNVYHASLGGDELLRLNTTAAKQTVSNYFNSINSSTFSVTSGNNANNSGDMVYYCFADVPGYQKVGSWIGNGSSTGPVVITGFRPKFLLFKRTDGTANWYIYDTERQAGNPVNKVIPPNTNNAEYTMTSMNIDFLNNGFQLKGTDGDMNNNNSVYIYLAIGDDEIGSDEDCLVDVPNAVTADEDATDTTGGYQRGNYATWNPVDSNLTHSNGNLDLTGTTAQTWSSCRATIGMPSGKFYWEVTVNSMSSTSQNVIQLGIGALTLPLAPADSAAYPDNYVFVNYTQQKYLNGNGSSYGNTFGVGDTVGVAFDADNGTLTFYINGVSQGVAWTGLDVDKLFAPVITLGRSSTSTSISSNFGQMRFKYAMPSGYAALNTTALPAATIADGSAHFDAKPYVGNGGTQTITGFNFQPSFLWTKVRDQSGNHKLVDAVRGVSERLESDTTDAEETVASGVTSFNSDGFTVGSSGTQNGNNYSLMSWAWNAGSSTVSNTDGSITSSVRANPSAGFSIVSWTGTGANGSIGHGLNSKPQIVITKNRTDASSWVVDVIGVLSSGTDYLLLNSDQAAGSGGSTADNSVVNILSYNDRNGSGDAMIAYCFTSVSGYCSIGKFTGNASATNGPFIYTGFKPALVVIKRTDAANDWNVQDYQRKAYNGQLTTSLQWNTNSSESSIGSGYERDFLSNGFKIRNTGTETNANGGTHLYIAFSQNPFQANGGLAR